MNRKQKLIDLEVEDLADALLELAAQSGAADDLVERLIAIGGTVYLNDFPYSVSGGQFNYATTPEWANRLCDSSKLSPERPNWSRPQLVCLPVSTRNATIASTHVSPPMGVQTFTTDF